MKSNTTKRGAERGPSKASLEELPEVDFEANRITSNPFAARVAREGIELHPLPPPTRRSAREPAPSAASLRELPETDFQSVRARKNPYARHIASEGVVLQVGRGRPPRSAEVGPTIPKSIRLPQGVWKRFAKRAEEQDLSVHAALRLAVLEWLERSSAVQ